MARNRFLALLTALCLLVSAFPFHTHAHGESPLEQLYHHRQQQEATREIRVDNHGQRRITPNSQAVLPAGDGNFLIEDTFDGICQWGIDTDGWLYIWCNGQMPVRSASGDYPWNAYREYFGGVYVDADTVADNAFAGCTNLQLVILEAGVSAVGQKAFAGCSSVEEFWFYGAAPAIASDAFTGMQCYMLYHFGDTSFDSLLDQHFGGSLSWTTWVDAVDGGMFDTVEWYVYEDNSLCLYGTGNPMQDMSTPESYPWHSYVGTVTYISLENISRVGNYAFMGCQNVTELENTANYIGDYAFSGIQVSSLDLTGVMAIGEGAFERATALTELVLPLSLNSIGANAFADCSALSRIRFDCAPPTIGKNAFKNVTATVTYHRGSTEWNESHHQSYGGKLTWEPYAETLAEGDLEGIHWVYTNAWELFLTGNGTAMPDLENAESYPWTLNIGQLRRLNVEGVTHIGAHSFQGQDMLEYIAFDETLVSIGDQAFAGCGYLKELSFAGTPPAVGTDSIQDTGYKILHPNTAAWTQEALDQLRGTTAPKPDDGRIPAGCGVYAEDVYEDMMALAPQYPEGMHWTNDDYYAWNGGIFSGGYGCAGFVFILSDAAFGNEPARQIYGPITIDQIRVGDILRINNDTHSVIALEVYEDHIVVAEGNYNSSIHWGRTFSAEKISSMTDYIMTRYPEHEWSSSNCLEERTCSLCGFHMDAPGHKWQDATCGSPKTCKSCGITEGQPIDHLWLEATCSRPQTCSLCGLTQGEPTGKHVFTGNGDSTCNVCGYARDIGTNPPEAASPIPEYVMNALQPINRKRLEAGLDPFTVPETLQNAANIRAQDLLSVFDHARPNGETWNSLLREANFPYTSGTENISRSSGSPAEVVKNWLDSMDHMQLFLDPDFGHFSVATSEEAWAEIYTDATAYTDIQVTVPESAVFPMGTPIEHMGLAIMLCNKAGNCWLPLDSAYCTGYDPALPGPQAVTVSVLGLTCTVTLTLEEDGTGHTHSWVDATCEAPKTCASCGRTEGAPLGHDWDAASCEAPGTCTRCGKTQGTALGHSWTAATCTTPKTCSVCGKTEGNALEHSWANATCQTPKTCSSCGKTEGSVLEHSWVDATCQTPKTCSVCNKTEGSVLEHSWADGVCTGCGMSRYAVSGRLDQPMPTREQLLAAYRAIPSATSLFDTEPSITAPYAPGKLSDSLLQNGLAYLNFIRLVANLPAQQLDSVLNEDAQHAAVIMAANDSISHTPSRPAGMEDAFYNRGYNAASSSNLYYSFGYTDLTCLKNAVQGFIDDSVGESNLQRVGHRRWVLNPQLLNVGLGFAAKGSAHFVAMKVFDKSGPAVDYDFVAWPSNNFPTNIIDLSVPWSVSLNPGKYSTPNINEIRITLTRRSDGKSWVFDNSQPYLFVDNAGFGSGSCIIFHPGSFVADPYSGVFEVQITGLKDRSGKDTELRYMADFFKLEQPHEHNFVPQVIAPTCVEEGYTLYTCGCGHTFSDTYVDPLGHDWTAASCEAPAVCSRCGKTEGNALGHSWTDATCDTAKTCSVCGKTEGKPLGHDWDAASCESPGTCARCGKTEGTAVGHSWVDATCDSPKTCSVCGKTEGSALDHDWIDASCEAPDTCRRCGKTKGTSLGHIWKHATCEEPKTCTRCGATEGDPLLHAWDNGKIAQQPTFETEGIKVYTCYDCGDTRTEPIPVLKNPFTAIDTPDTLASRYDIDYDIPKDGATVLIFFSSLCGNSQALMRRLNNCDWMANPWLDVVAIETKVGTAEATAEFRDTFTPDVKDHIRYLHTTDTSAMFDYFRLFSAETTLYWPMVMIITGSEEAPVVRFGAHGMSDANALENILAHASPAFAGWDGTAHEHTWVDATCQTPKTCSACGQTEGTALGHDWKPASCETAKTCARCGETEGSATGHKWLDATCQAPKTCSACGKTEGKALGHDWKAASCEAPKTCARCGETEGSATGHKWLDATCQAPKTCSACGKTEGKAVDHQFTDGKCTMCGTQERKLGDADGNGILNYSDALLILRASIGLETLPQEILDICDVSGDGIANYSDALLILRFSIGLITSFPVEK